MKSALYNSKTPANDILTPFTGVSSFKITRQTSPYAFICFANFSMECRIYVGLRGTLSLGYQFLVGKDFLPFVFSSN